MSRRVVLLRHGETVWNAEGRWQGHDGGGLSARGRAQAAAAAAHLARQADDVVALVRSDLERVEATAAPILARLEAPEHVDARWREIDVGSWSGRTHAEVAEVDPEGYAAWAAGEDPRRGGGETDAELHARVAAALDELIEGSGTVIVVTHGGPVRHAVAHALGVGPGGRHRLGRASNTGMTTLVRGRGGWRLLGYDATDHLGGMTSA
ncbi:MAG: histidine phosphatase family protein [Actinomycetota bacterium]